MRQGFRRSAAASACLWLLACEPANTQPQSAPDAGPPAPYKALLSVRTGINEDWVPIPMHVKPGLALAFASERQPASPLQTGILTVINPTDGSHPWEPESGTAGRMPVLAPDGTIYTVSSIGENTDQPTLSGPGHVFATSPEGTLLWKVDLHVRAMPLPPVPAGNSVLVVQAGKLHSIAAGSVTWSDASRTHLSEPLFDGTTIYTHSKGTTIGVRALTTAGAEVWTSPALGQLGTVERHGRMALGGSSLILCVSSTADDRGGVYALDKATGAMRWFFGPPAGMLISENCAVASDGRVFVRTLPPSLQSFNDPGGHLHGLNADSGSEAWKFPLVGKHWAPAIGPEGRIYISDMYGLHALEPSGTLAWAVPGPRCKPVFVNGRIYATGYRVMYALESDGTLAWSHAIEAGAYDSHVFEGVSPAVSSDGVVLFSWVETEMRPIFVVSHVLVMILEERRD